MTADDPSSPMLTRGEIAEVVGDVASRLSRLAARSTQLLHSCTPACAAVGMQESPLSIPNAAFLKNSIIHYSIPPNAGDLFLVTSILRFSVKEVLQLISRSFQHILAQAPPQGASLLSTS